jgi:hypothetical protein
VKNLYFDEISEINSNEWDIKEKQNPQLLELEPLSQEEKEKFIARAKIKVPIEEEYQYEDLLCKCHDVFSKDKQDLGKANNFEHKIEKKKTIK